MAYEVSQWSSRGMKSNVVNISLLVFIFLYLYRVLIFYAQNLEDPASNLLAP